MRSERERELKLKRETERDRDRERQRDRAREKGEADRHAGRQADRQRDMQADRPADRWRDGERTIHRERDESWTPGRDDWAMCLLAKTITKQPRSAFTDGASKGKGRGSSQDCIMSPLGDYS